MREKSVKIEILNNKEQIFLSLLSTYTGYPAHIERLEFP
jgi:hypothetical protein